MSVAFDTFHKVFRMTLKGSISYPVDLSTDTFGNITRINNVLRSLPERLEKSKGQLANLHNEVKEQAGDIMRKLSEL